MLRPYLRVNNRLYTFDMRQAVANTEVWLVVRFQVTKIGGM